MTKRLDQYLVDHQWYETRNKAKNAIVNNLLLVNNKVINKPSYEIKESDIITKVKTQEYVSRGAYKLLAAIKEWKINFNNKVVLDIGASTGGFSEVALLHGAKLVYAVDVGTNQLHHSLKANPKLISLEQTHFNQLSLKHILKKVDIVVADISFISLTKLMDKLNKLITDPHCCIFLIKPEFELSPQELNKGKVKSQKSEGKAIHKITQHALALHYKIIGVIPSPIKGNKRQNTEYLIFMERR